MKTTGYPGVATGVISVGIVYLIVAAIVALLVPNGLKNYYHQLFWSDYYGDWTIIVWFSSSVATLLNGKYDIFVYF